MEARVVISGSDERTINDLPYHPEASDEQILEDAGKILGVDLSGHSVTRHEENILIHPTPVFG